MLLRTRMPRTCNATSPCSARPSSFRGEMVTAAAAENRSMATVQRRMHSSCQGSPSLKAASSAWMGVALTSIATMPRTSGWSLLRCLHRDLEDDLLVDPCPRHELPLREHDTALVDHRKIRE